jgi:hypothetical protein
MGKLQKDIKSQSDWIVKAFASDGYNLDYTIDSYTARCIGKPGCPSFVLP